MLLDRLTNNKTQAQAVSGLDLLTTSKNLATQLETFLLSCRVDELSPATIKNYQYQLRRFVSFCIKLSQDDAHYITSHHVRHFLLSLQETNNPTSIGDYYKTLKRFFNWLIAEGILSDTPMHNIKPPRKVDKIVKPFSAQDIEHLLILCSGNRLLDLRNKAIILMFLDTGLRLSELANIQLADVNFDQETIRVMGKGKKERVVRIGKTTQKALLRYLLARSDSQLCLWVTEESKPLTRDGVQSAIKKLCYRAGITDAKPGPHTFRHTAAIHCLRNGMGEFALQMMLGHATLRMTRRYVSTLGQEDMIKAHLKASPVDKMFSK